MSTRRHELSLWVLATMKLREGSLPALLDTRDRLFKSQVRGDTNCSHSTMQITFQSWDQVLCHTKHQQICIIKVEKLAVFVFIVTHLLRFCDTGMIIIISLQVHPVVSIGPWVQYLQV